MMRTLLTLSFALVAPAALPQSRPQTTNMTCGAAASLVQTQGAAVLGTGRDTFDRFVRDASFCAHGQVLKPAIAPTADQRQCQVAWRCYDEPQENR